MSKLRFFFYYFFKKKLVLGHNGFSPHSYVPVSTITSSAVFHAVLAALA